MLATWWRKYWKIRIPRKILIFGWRGFHKILPTTKGLKRRNKSGHSNCPICSFGEDSNAHAIFWCIFAQELWGLLEYPFLVGQKEEISFRDVLLYVSKFLDEEDFVKILITSWGIWSERNKKSHGQQTTNPLQLKVGLSLYYEEIKNAQMQDGEPEFTGEHVQRDQTEIELSDSVLFVDAAVSTTT